jgi:diguanylate cyclase (GGDEF)-like protein/PAS domain S-box-containing protein
LQAGYFHSILYEMKHEEIKECRKYERFPFREDVLIDGTRMCRSMNISESGLYISAIQSYKKNSVMDVSIPYKGKKLTVNAQVRHCQPGIGMGMMLVDLKAEQRAKIKELIGGITKKPSELRKRAEKKIKSEITTLKVMSDKEKQQLIHELQVHQIELEMQNEELRSSQSELEESRAKYSDLYDFAPVGYLTFDKQGLILEANLTVATELGLERSFLVKKPFRAYIAMEDREIFDSHLHKVFKSGVQQACEIRLKRKDGSEFYAQLESNGARDSLGNNICRNSLTDITGRKFKEEEIKRLATVDTLTGAFNRQKFNEIIEREMEGFKRYRHCFSMILCDIDRFKEVNDRYGHDAGDYVLRTIADIIRGNIRRMDYFVRWGGEEFIILSSETQLDKAYALSARIRKKIESYRFDNIGTVTVSFGVTEFREGDTGTIFIKRADNALYEAKNKGRNRVEVAV